MKYTEVHGTQDVAASIVMNKPPTANLVFPPEDSMISAVDNPLTSYDCCLWCLAFSLRLIHSELVPMLSGFHESCLQPVGSHVPRWDRWFELWSRCMTPLSRKHFYHAFMRSPEQHIFPSRRISLTFVHAGSRSKKIGHQTCCTRSEK